MKHAVRCGHDLDSIRPGLSLSLINQLRQLYYLSSSSALDRVNLRRYTYRDKLVMKRRLGLEMFLNQIVELFKFFRA